MIYGMTRLVKDYTGNSVPYKYVTEWFLEIRDEYGN